jgi:hypothetical protein
VRANTDEFVRRLVDAGDRAVDRLEREARKHPAMTAAAVTAEIVGTVVTFGAGETVVAGVATYLAYRALRRKEAREREQARPGSAPARARSPEE